MPTPTLSGPSVSLKPTSITACLAESTDSFAIATCAIAARLGPTTTKRFPAIFRRNTGPTASQHAVRKPAGSFLNASAWPRSGTEPGASGGLFSPRRGGGCDSLSHAIIAKPRTSEVHRMGPG